MLDEVTRAALGYGINFSICDEKVDWVGIAKSFCNLEKFGSLSIEDFNICKGIVYGACSFKCYSNVPGRFLKAYSNLKKDETLHITKADKSNALVLINKGDYVNKMLVLLSDQETYSVLNHNPLEKVISRFNKKT